MGFVSSDGRQLKKQFTRVFIVDNFLYLNHEKAPTFQWGLGNWSV